MAENNTFSHFKNSLDESSLRVSDENFKLPDMGDYYNTAVDDPYIKMIDETIREVANGDSVKAEFYIDKPYVTTFGTHDLEGVYFLKAKPDISDKADRLGKFDGDTLYFDRSTIEADQETKDRVAGTLEVALNELKSLTSASELGPFHEVGVRFLGINTPEVPKFAIDAVKLEEETITTLIYSEAKKRDSDVYIFQRGINHDDLDVIKFIKLYDTWHEYTEIEPGDELKLKKGQTAIQYLTKEGEQDPAKLAAGLKAKKLVKELVKKANGEVYFMLDRTSLTRSSERYPGSFGVNSFSSGLINKLKYWWQQTVEFNSYKYGGFTQWGQDNHGRFLGTPYVKVDIDGNGTTEWINLAKYVIAEVPEVEIFPDYGHSPLFQDNFGFASKAFKLHTYDFKNRILADAAGLLAEKLDDRRKVQREIFGQDFDALKDWTVTIGDTTFFVPPTSIRSVVNTTHERIPLIRSKGSMTKGALKEERMLEMTIYFNDERGINGYEYEATLPDQTKITYYMNGLRALISQFKFTPYLPIDNHYINEILNIDAVTLVNLQISTLPNYPKCIAAVLTLQEFDYMQFMPELPVRLDENDAYRNIFAGTINYEVMRWYYQRALITGQELKDVDVNSREYLEKTYGHRTALIPMKFDRPNIKFFTANEEHLKRMLQVKMDSIKRPNAKIILSDIEKEVAKDVSQVYVQLSNMLGSDNFKNALDGLMTVEDGELLTVEHKKDEIKTDGDLTGTGLKVIKDESWEEAVSSSKFESQVNDFLNVVRMEMFKINETAGKTLISGGKLVYKEKDIDKVEAEYGYGGGIGAMPQRNPDGTFKTVNTSGPPKVVKGDVVLGVEFSIQLDYLTDPENQIQDLLRDASLTTQLVMNEKGKEVFMDKKIFIPFKGTFERDKNAYPMPYVMNKDAYKFKLESMSEDVQFIAYCYSLATQLGLNNGQTVNEEVAEIKQLTDMDSMENLVYEDYDIGDVHIKNISAGFGNVFTRVSLNGTSGYAPQYLGGQDTIIEVTLETTSMESVGMISALPRIATQLARDYRLVIPASPLKIDSEITKLLGVNEVVMENLNIDTVPNQPGLFQITMRLVSMDRTMRNREGLTKINEFAHSGRQSTDEEIEMQMQTYFDLNKTLAQAELYPDLELPELEELNKHGFYFISYKFEEYRVYPDPDFYFVYGHVLQSQIFREAIENAQAAGLDGMKWVDQFGGEMKTKAQKGVGVKAEEVNEKSQGISDKMKQAAKVSEQMPDEKEFLKSQWDIINTLRAADVTDSWNISEDIKTVFLEPAYSSLLNNYNQVSTTPSEKDKADDSAGKWVHDAMKPAREASELIAEFLAKAPTPPKEYEYPYVAGDMVFYSKQAPHVQDESDTKMNELLANETVAKIFEKLEIKVDRKFKKALKNIIWAAACAATSEKEYTGKKSDPSWKPNKNFIGMRVSNAQDDSGKMAASTAEEAIKYGVEFGAYRIKMHTKDEIKRITGESIPDNIFYDVEQTDTNSMNTSHFLLDPYFRRASITLEEVEEYKKHVIGNLPYATEAFFRIILLWMKRMIDDNILPNMSLDVLKGEFQSELSEAFLEKYKENGTNMDEEMSEMQKYLEFLEKGDRAIDGGKIFAAAVMSVTNSSAFYEPMKQRNYNALNGMIDGAMSGSGDYSPTDMDYILLRKMLLALVGVGEIKKETEIGKQAENPITDFKKALNEKKYIDAAEDPNRYIKHSFYDMIVNDRRGRMCRAFPTFYVVFVDAGREIGLWKLHDNFYNINAISEIQVSKSRKNPADTCRIVLSNLFHTLTTEDEDSNLAYEADWQDVFTAVFNPSALYRREEARRMKQQPLNRAKLTPGTRIHVRMGYGSNAANLPISFNGKIAEVSAGEVVEIVAQGDGVELLNPILDSTEAHKKKNQDKNVVSRFIQNLFSSAATPKTIIDAFLTSEGGWGKKVTREITNGYYFNDHPLGITHFGNPRYDLLFKAGEPTQNIFEAINKPAWADMGSGITGEWSMDEAPKFTIDVFGKTFWDILNICGSASPDFIVGVAPFGFRSTIFHGHPRYYYAYEYHQDTDGTVLERRKPYQQYHIYTSYSDIIKNDIKASSQEIKTNAMGLYKLKKWLTRESQEKVGPLWVDWDIYPESQKSMVYDTQLLSNGVPVLGTIVPFVDKAFDWFSDDTGKVQGGHEVAWRMTANALKQSIHDMYQGELIIVGDPSVKPHDRFYLYDIYENMSGSALVEGVIHNFSAENGFTTTIYPDCIAAVDDRHELAVQTVAGAIVSSGLYAYIATVVPTMIWGRSFTPMLAMTSKQSRSILYNAAKLSKKIGANKTARKLVKSAQATKKVYKAGKLALAGGAVIASGGTALIPLAALAMEMAIVHTMTNFVHTLIERDMKNKQVLQIFPLKKNQKVLTAGLNGSKGVIYGSPTYDMQGAFDSLFSKLNTETNGFGAGWNFVINLLATDEMKAIAKKYERGTNMVEEEGAAVSEEKAIDKMLKALASNQSRTQSGYYRLLLSPRLAPDAEDYDDKLFDVYDNLAFLNTSGIEIQPRITNELIYVKQDDKLKEAMEKGLLQTSWDLALPENQYEYKEFNIGGKKEQIRAIVEETDSAKRYDIPFLHPDAITILRELIIKTSYFLPEVEPEVEKTPVDYLTLQSALVVGDDETFASLAFSFVVEAMSDKAKQAFIDAIASVEKEIEEMYNLGEITNKKLFSWELGKNPGGKEQLFMFTVYPPLAE